MKALIPTTLLAVLLPHLLFGQTVQTNAANLLSRHYQDGEKLSYHMKTTNKGFFGTTSYEADAIGVVKKDSRGRFFEEYSWASLIVNHKKIPLPGASESVRQSLSLDPHYGFSGFPDLTRVDPHLTGPMLDLFNFYVDLQLAIRQKNLAHAGDHVFLKYGKSSSWARGSVILGEDSIDFDITLKDIDQARQGATVVIRHVPPLKPEINIPADWMRAPVADTPNNWVQVSRNDSYRMVIATVVGIGLLLLFLLFRKWSSRRRWMVRTSFFLVAGLLILFAVGAPYFHYMAMVGQEMFDCDIKVNLADGKILSATMDNPVEVVARPCRDATLTKHGPSFRGHFRRQIEIELMPAP
ncbi:MAG TPA: hypothetical protein VFC44_18680 [Candidatus Saccharimonadales bacterium]|nr:hypothetical protein [Candidatus Saccharimonadales bacterium]